MPIAYASKVHIHNAKDATHQRYSTPQIQYTKEILQPKLHRTNDSAHQRCQCIPKVHMHIDNTKDAMHRRYITPKIYCNQDIIHQSCSAPTIMHTKVCQCITYQRCRYIAPMMQCTEDAVHQRNIAINMYIIRKSYIAQKLTKDSLHQRCSSPKMHPTRDIMH